MIFAKFFPIRKFGEPIIRKVQNFHPAKKVCKYKAQRSITTYDKEHDESTLDSKTWFMSMHAPNSLVSYFSVLAKKLVGKVVNMLP